MRHSQIFLSCFAVLMLFLCFAPSLSAVAEISAQGERDVSAPAGIARDEPMASDLPPEIPPPHFASRKVPQPDLLLLHKREGWFMTGFPAIGWDPDTGFNIGAAAQIFDNGSKESPFFRITPYRKTIQVMAVYSTTNTLQMLAYYDQPYIQDTPWRVRGDFFFTHNPEKNYFGIGDDGQKLTLPGTGQVSGDYDEYKDALKQQVNGETNERYDTYRDTRVGMRATAEYDLVGGWLRPLVGFQVARVWTSEYTGDTVHGATQLPSHLRDDCDAGRAIGCDGGWDIFVKLGIAFDTRDFEPNPRNGVLWEVVSELSPKFLGSGYYYGRLSTTFKGYAPIFDYREQHLVLAGRFFYQWQFGDVPFYAMNNLAFTERDFTGLGGFRSLRGYRLDRFIGPVAMMTNMELRYTFTQFDVWQQHIQLGVKPFLDAGRVFDKVSETSLRDWKLGGGCGLTIIWNLATVINFDASWSPEGTALYMEAGVQF